MKYVVKDAQEKLHVVEAAGFVPDGVVCAAPQDASHEDGELLDLETYTDEMGQERVRAVVNETRKTAKTTARDEADEASRVDRLRKPEYPSTDELVVALWEKVIENRPEAAVALQAKREAVKAKYPKGAR